VEYNARIPENRLRYLILSDIHANLEAFKKCQEVSEGKYDQVLCLGDVVGYGPDPNAAIEEIRGMARLIIRGNHDKACCGITDAEDFNLLARQATLWTRGELTPENLAFLRTLPVGPVAVNGFEMVHGSPLDEDEYIFGPGQALPTLRALTIQVVLFGHTHFQGGFMTTTAGRFQSIRCSSKEDGLTSVLPLEDGARYLINPGSVGQPRDGDWRAAFAILDDEAQQVEYYRTPYELPVTQAKMHKAGLPVPLIKRLELGR
jgi:predicted phosphodiesterase